MKKFQVIIHRDAWINYAASISAESAEDATEQAKIAWEKGDKAVTFDEIGLSEFDDVTVDVGDTEEIEA